MKYVCFLLLTLLSVSAYSQNWIKPEKRNYLDFKVAESKREARAYFKGMFGSNKLSPYKGGEMPSIYHPKDRMISLISKFYIAQNETELCLVCPPIFYACCIYINGKKIVTRGNADAESSNRIHLIEKYELPEDFLSIGSNKPNEIVVELYPFHGEKTPIEPMFITNKSAAESYVYWRTFFSLDFIKAMALVSLFVGLYFFIFYFTRNQRRTSYYLPFAFLCFSYILAHTNNIFINPNAHNLIIEKATKIGFAIWSYSTVCYLLAYTEITRYKKKIMLYAPIFYMPGIVLMIFAKDMRSLLAIYTSYVFIVTFAMGAFSMAICLLFVIQKWNKQSKLLAFINFLSIPCFGYDSYYVLILQIKPYAFTLPYIMFLAIVAFFFIVAWEQSELYQLVVRHQRELQGMYDKLEGIVEERTSQLTQANTEFEMLFKNINSGFAYSEIIYDAENKPIDYTFKRVNKSYEKLTGFKKDDIIGRRVREIIPYISMEWIEKMGHVATTGAPLKIDHFFNPAQRYYDISVFSPKKGFFAILFEDTTEIYNYRLQLEESEKRFRSIYLNSPQAIALVDKQRKYIDINPAFTDILGYTLQDISNQLVGMLSTTIEGNPIRGIFEQFPQILNTEYHGEFIAQHSNGSHVWIELNAKTQLNSKKEFDYIMLIFADITSRKINEENEKQYLAKQIDLNNTKNKFFNMIAHDLRNPFNNILGYSEMLSSNISTLDDDKIVKFARNIHRSAQKSHRLLENLLDWAMSQTGKIGFEPETINFKDLFTEIKHLTESMLLDKELILIDKTPDQARIYADRNMLEVIVRNLVTNAIKYTPRRGEIQVSYSNDHLRYTISVKDTGIGMSKKQIEDLLQTNNTPTAIGTENEKGTGLGLLLCKEFIAKHHGQLHIISNPMEGSEFIVSIPMPDAINGVENNA